MAEADIAAGVDVGVPLESVEVLAKELETVEEYVAEEVERVADGAAQSIADAEDDPAESVGVGHSAAELLVDQYVEELDISPDQVEDQLLAHVGTARTCCSPAAVGIEVGRVVGMAVAVSVTVTVAFSFGTSMPSEALVVVTGAKASCATVFVGVAVGIGGL